MAGNASPADELAGLDLLLADDLRPEPGSVGQNYSPNLTVTTAGIAMDGAAETPTSYLVQFTPTALRAGATLVALGRLEKGGVAIGLLRDNVWAGQGVVSQPGPFAVIVPITAAGTYMPIVTNAMGDGDQHSRFVITKFGLADAATPGGVPDAPIVKAGRSQ